LEILRHHIAGDPKKMAEGFRVEGVFFTTKLVEVYLGVEVSDAEYRTAQKF